MSHPRRQQERDRQMNTSTILRTPLLALSFVCMSAQAEWRCDCSTILDTCSATVTVEDDWVSIESDHGQCARVDYLIDGLPFVALVVEGSERQSWLSRSDNPRVLMQSCQVCVDKADAPAPVALRGELTVADEGSREDDVSRLLAVDPQYPSSAAGTAGFVEVSFTVTALGRVENASVTAAEPPGVFEEAALTAISRWRYGADEGRQPVTLSHRFDFKSQDAVIDPSAPSPATAETAINALIARSAARGEGEDTEVAASERNSVVRNHCIREQLSYDFGEMVEIGLMNACSEPLIVYACAEGMGRYQRRWVCQSTENAHSILVRPGDRLAGNVAMIEIPEGVRTFKYAEDLLVTRPPNTQYWWLACGVDDAECRGSGRQWARSMAGKAASVDPQLWTEQSVARSY
jgi:TonB family protein